MARKTIGRSLAVVCAAASVGCLAAGCHHDTVGDTVPSPPRELIEQSFRKGKAPIARPVPGAPAGRPNSPQ